MAEINIEKMAHNVAEKAIQELRDNGVFIGRWISVDERFPKENGGYLVTVKQGYVTTALWVGNAKNWNEVTAWMPLPKSYKAEQEET